jgi:hypothetical protein
MPDDYTDAYPELYEEGDGYGSDVAGLANGFHPGFVDDRLEHYGIDQRIPGEDQDFLEQHYGRMVGRAPYVGYGHVPPSSPYRS